MAIEPLLSRRYLLKGLALAGATGSAGARQDRFDGATAPLAAWATADHRAHRIGKLTGPSVILPARAHEVARDPHHPKHAWAVARRPGEWLWRIDLSQARITTAIALDEMRRFEGHLLPWTQGGRTTTLFDSETSTEEGQGVLASRDPSTLALRDEWPTGGIGPHALMRWGEDGVLVANGGLLLLPETGRQVRNADAVRSHVVHLNTRNGQLRESWSAPQSGLSLRHLACATDGTLGVAMQAVEEGQPTPVFAFKPPGEKHLVLAQADDALLQQVRGYAGAIACAGDQFAVSCPHGDRLLIWSNRGRLQAELVIPGACALRTTGTGWQVLGRAGAVYEVAAGASCRFRLLYREPQRVWDNHLG